MTFLHEDPARLAVLEQLRSAALQAYGEERAADAGLQAAIELAATAICRVIEEPLGPELLSPFGHE